MCRNTSKSWQSSKDTRKILIFYRTVQPFVKLYDIELGDQEFFTQFISIDILWAHGLHICAPVEKAIDGLSISLWTNAIVQDRTVFATQGSILSLCSQWKSCCTKLCRCTQREKVVKMLLTHLFCSRLDQEGRQTTQGGWEPPSQLKPPDVMEGATHHCHGNQPSVIFDFDHQQGFDEIPLACFLLSRWQDFQSWEATWNRL